MHVQPVTLQGKALRLEPLSTAHADDLLRYSGDEIYTYSNLRPAEYTLEALTHYIEKSVAWPDRLAFAMVLQSTGEAVGTTSYHDIAPTQRRLAIGFTWIGIPHQGTFVNPESKYLMLSHAFEGLGAVRVQLQADLRNTHSLRAIEKLGAKREGVLRKHMILPDGYIRDSVIFSIIAEEWPEVKAGLVDRLGYTP